MDRGATCAKGCLLGANTPLWVQSSLRVRSTEVNVATRAAASASGALSAERAA